MGGMITDIRRICGQSLVLLISLIILGESAWLRAQSGPETTSPSTGCFLSALLPETAIAGEPRTKTDPLSSASFCIITPRPVEHSTGEEIGLKVQRHVLETFEPTGLVLLKSLSTSSSL